MKTVENFRNPHETLKNGSFLIGTEETRVLRKVWKDSKGCRKSEHFLRWISGM